MTEPRVPLEVRVDDEHRHGDRPQPADDRVELEDRHQKQRECGRAERQYLPACQRPAGQLPARGARILRVEFCVDEPVQRHRERAGSHHGDRHPDQLVPPGPLARGKKDARVGEGQREHGVLDANERREAPRKGDGRRRHVCRCGVLRSPAASSRPWRKAGRGSRSRPCILPASRAGSRSTSRREALRLPVTEPRAESG